MSKFDNIEYGGSHQSDITLQTVGNSFLYYFSMS